MRILLSPFICFFLLHPDVSVNVLNLNWIVDLFNICDEDHESNSKSDTHDDRLVETVVKVEICKHAGLVDSQSNYHEHDDLLIHLVFGLHFLSMNNNDQI